MIVSFIEIVKNQTVKSEFLKPFQIGVTDDTATRIR
jgi:hypothetical protein